MAAYFFALGLASLSPSVVPSPVVFSPRLSYIYNLYSYLLPGAWLLMPVLAVLFLAIRPLATGCGPWATWLSRSSQPCS